jgi:hypothetical protein
LRICLKHIPEQFYEIDAKRKVKLLPGARPLTYAEEQALSGQQEQLRLNSRSEGAKIATRNAVYTASPGKRSSPKRKASRTKPLTYEQLEKLQRNQVKNLEREIEQVCALNYDGIWLLPALLIC